MAMAGAADAGELASNIMPHILSMLSWLAGLSPLCVRQCLLCTLSRYNCRATAADFEVYAPDASFEDPLMRADGVKQIKSAFYALAKVFSEGKMVDYTVEVNEASPGNGEIKIDNVQQYKLMGRRIDMKSLIKLQVQAGKVVHHEDLWNKKPFLSPESTKLPLVGTMARGVRRCNMMVTHVLMGRGKDPVQPIQSS